MVGRPRRSDPRHAHALRPRRMVRLPGAGGVPGGSVPRIPPSLTPTWAPPHPRRLLPVAHLFLFPQRIGRRLDRRTLPPDLHRVTRPLGSPVPFVSARTPSGAGERPGAFPVLARFARRRGIRHSARAGRASIGGARAMADPVLSSRSALDAPAYVCATVTTCGIPSPRARWRSAKSLPMIGKLLGHTQVQTKACPQSLPHYVIEKHDLSVSSFESDVNGRRFDIPARTSGQSSASLWMIQGAPLQACRAARMPERMSRRMTTGSTASCSAASDRISSPRS